MLLKGKIIIYFPQIIFAQLTIISYYIIVFQTLNNIENQKNKGCPRTSLGIVKEEVYLVLILTSILRPLIGVDTVVGEAQVV